MAVRADGLTFVDRLPGALPDLLDDAVDFELLPDDFFLDGPYVDMT